MMPRRDAWMEPHRKARKWNEKRLKDHGYVTELSRRIQLETFEHGPMTAKELAKRLNVPEEDIWAVMVWLEGKGWLNIE